MRGGTLIAKEIELINAAMLLRRPLLVSGKPGSGKSSLAYSLAFELQLGRILRWPITSRSTLRDGLYRYDAIGRLHEAGRQVGMFGDSRADRRGPDSQPSTDDIGSGTSRLPEIGRFLQLGPLGTALLPYKHPRVLLIDEIDKSDIDFPNDLLNILEDGEFEIPELARLPAAQREVEVRTDDPDGAAFVTAGRVQCSAFPIIVLTSNGEREFPPAFRRRCIQINLAEPDLPALQRIISAQLGPESTAASERLVEYFLRQKNQRTIATDQLLNAIYLRMSGELPDRLRDGILRPIDGSDG
ncbi:MoxR family ATPase [Frankia sp. CiP3]|uniref:AAA family ATPase n=1 Tax=Frankia sp. CiP3 TaxID=2880971 RepID=UPI001EF6753F|nr:MoxR family ATPase [Frankia sp. CiP3]